MDFTKRALHKILSILRVRSIAGGLEVSDQVLRLVYFDGKGWKLGAVRLEPGVMEKGKIMNGPALATALAELKAQIPFSRNKKKKMDVIVSLSSVKMYSQVFALPFMEGKSLAGAVDLNMKMISPLEASQAYFGWEEIGKDEANGKAEIAAAFVDKTIVDGMGQALYSAGFVTVGIESRALALARIFREKGAGADVKKAYLFLDIDNNGIDFLVIRNGRLYFEYPTEWGDLGDEKGQISMQKFQETLGANLRQVLNFYTQHWSEPLAAIVLSAAVFADEAEQAVGAVAASPVIRLTLEMGQPISSEWLTALGCSLRGTSGYLEDSEINLAGPDAVDMFHNEQLMNFLALWRVLVPAVLAVIIVACAVADNFLSSMKIDIGSKAVLNQAESQQAQSLQASSTAFNQLITLAANAESQIGTSYLMIEYLNNLASKNSITVNRLSFGGQGTPVLFAGSAPTEDTIVAFKAAIQGDPHFGAVNLPLADIQQDGSQFTFSMTFPVGEAFK